MDHQRIYEDPPNPKNFFWNESTLFPVDLKASPMDLFRNDLRFFYIKNCFERLADTTAEWLPVKPGHYFPMSISCPTF